MENNDMYLKNDLRENSKENTYTSMFLFIFLILFIFFIGCHINENYGSKKENLGGTNWFPRSYLKDIRQSTDFTYHQELEKTHTPSNPNNSLQQDETSTLETPIFAYFDNNSRLKNPYEVDSLYADITHDNLKPFPLQHTFQDSNEKHYSNQHDILMQRGGNS